MRISQLEGKRVALWGWGREGRAAYGALRARDSGSGIRGPEERGTLPLTLFCSGNDVEHARALGDPGLQVETEAFAAVFAGTIEQHRVGLLQALGRFSQGAGGQATAIAQAARGIDQHQFQVAGQAVVLHAVVAQDQVQRFAGQQRLHGTGAVGVDHQRHAGALHDQQRLIARLVGALVSLHAPG